MTYAEAIEYIHSVSWRGSVPGLSRIRTLSTLMGNPEKDLKCIHIAGTNGKGSTAAYLTAVLRAAGYSVGTFTSPYVRTFNERIAINGKPVSNRMIADTVEFIKPFADSMDDRPTEFELLTAVGFEIFRRKKCDIVVLEVGLGGRYDSTNIITSPLLSVITGIAKDHMNLLGDTLDKIAWEKAGIIKPNRPVCMASLAPEAKKVILSEAKECNSEASEVEPDKILLKSSTLDGLEMDYKNMRGLRSTLIGLYQPRNIALVCEAVKKLDGMGVFIGEDALRRGIAEAKWHARFEVLQKNPTVIFDGGHNEEGVSAAIDTVKHLFDGKVNFVTGVMADKAYKKMAEIIAPCANEVFTVTPDNPRALSAEELAEVYRQKSISATPCISIAAALRLAKRRSKEQNRPLIILGSLYMYKDVYRHFR